MAFVHPRRKDAADNVPETPQDVASDMLYTFAKSEVARVVDNKTVVDSYNQQTHLLPPEAPRNSTHTYHHTRAELQAQRLWGRQAERAAGWDSW